MPRYHSECPYVIRKPFGVDCKDGCTMTGRTCLLELGQDCATWTEIQRDWEYDVAAEREREWNAAF